MTIAEGKLAATRFDRKITLHKGQRQSISIGKRELKATTSIIPIVKIINNIKKPVPKVNSQHKTKKDI